VDVIVLKLVEDWDDYYLSFHEWTNFWMNKRVSVQVSNGSSMEIIPRLYSFITVGVLQIVEYENPLT